MIITGQKQIFLSSQPNKFSYDLAISSLNNSGGLAIGFSGQSGNFLNYTFESGRIYDYNGDFVYSYGSNSTINISANVENSVQSYFINNVPIKLGEILNTGAGQVDTFYINPTNVTPEITFSFYGDRPSFYFSTVNFNELNPTGTGYIVNNDPLRYFQFYSGASTNTDYSYVSGFTGIIGPGQSGAVLWRKTFEPSSADDFSNSLFELSGNIYTNFGQLNTGFSGQNNFAPSQNLTVDFFTTISGSGTFNNFFNWQNLRGFSEFTSSGLPITFTLSRLSGGGDFTGTWNLQTGTQTFPYVYTDVVYNAGIQSYSGDFNTIGASGLSVAIQRLNYTGDTQILEFNLYGYSQTITISYTGV
jgi:hypothetical protein